MASAKTIGLIGGMSWESTSTYYRLINEGIAERLGGLHSAPMILWSVDFAPIETMQREGRWDEAGEALATIAVRLERAGAQIILLATNTMHKVAEQIGGRISVPFLHIADVSARAIRARGLDRAGLLGTRFTMEEAFYRAKIEEHGIAVLVPEEADRALVDGVIFRELCLGRIHRESREAFVRVMDALERRGAECIIAGCTEIGMLVGPGDTSLPFFDTTRLHAEAAVEAALA
ncbi:MAG: aspartate/glutamate racemase family protein [Spirochaetales bacterium]